MEPLFQEMFTIFDVKLAESDCRTCGDPVSRLGYKQLLERILIKTSAV